MTERQIARAEMLTEVLRLYQTKVLGIRGKFTIVMPVLAKTTASKVMSGRIADLSFPATRISKNPKPDGCKTNS